MDSLSHEKYLAPGVAALTLLALGATACGGAKDTCLSPFKSHYFPGARNAVQDDQNTWQGIELVTDLPDSVKGLRVDFTDPGGNRHISDWIDTGDVARLQ
jgi:hypothetical protein